MTIEEKLREYILSRYKSLREFVNTSGVGLSYSTVDGMLKRGIGGASINNVIKVCDALHISTDELANNKIVPKGEALLHTTRMKDINKIVEFTQRNLTEYDDLTLDGKPLTVNEVAVIMDALEISVGILRRNRKRKMEVGHIDSVVSEGINSRASN